MKTKIVQYPNVKLSCGTFWSEPSEIDFAQMKNKCAILCRKHDGIAIAAPQIGLLERWFYHADWHEIVVNPRLTAVSKGHTIVAKEGCLSIRSFLYSVERFQRVTMEWEDENGELRSRDLDGWDARIVQHEIDHLKGICIADK